MAEILQAIASMLWPLVLAVSFVVLYPTIKGILRRSESIDVEILGTKISIQRAAKEFGELIKDLQNRVNELEDTRAGAAEGPIRKKTPVPAAPSPRNAVLWVDDRPEANVYERARLAEAGLRVIQAESTKSALERLHENGPFGVIVSDMRRAEEGGRINERAGLDLLHALRKRGDTTPVVFYSSRRSLTLVEPELDGVAHVSFTASPSELMRLLQLSDA